MNTQTNTHLSYFQVTEEAEGTINLGRKNHYNFNIITDFRGPITCPTFSKTGNRLYMPFKEEDRAIIPNLAYRIHRRVRKAGHKELQVIIGHDLLVGPETPAVLPQPKPQIVVPQLPVVPVKPQPEIDWEKVAKVTGVLLVGMMGVAAISIQALLGTVLLADPSYCICLDDGLGTVIELLSWDTEV